LPAKIKGNAVERVRMRAQRTATGTRAADNGRAAGEVLDETLGAGGACCNLRVDAPRHG